MELSEFNGWENKFTWLVHLHLSNEQLLMQEVVAVVNSTRRKRASARLLKSWVKLALFNWLCISSERYGCFDENMQLLAWDLAGSALAYMDWDVLVKLLMGQTKKSRNLFTMTLFRYIESDGNLHAFIQEMVQAFPRLYECADMMQAWFREQIDMLFDGPNALPQPGMRALVHDLLETTYCVVVWEHVARAFQPEY